MKRHTMFIGSFIIVKMSVLSKLICRLLIEKDYSKIQMKRPKIAVTVKKKKRKQEG